MCLEKSSMPFLMETYSWSKEQRPAGKQAVFTPVFLEEREAPPRSLFLTMVTRLNHIFSISASLPTAITEPLNIKNVSLNQKLKRNVLSIYALIMSQKVVSQSLLQIVPANLSWP